jgi:hypothetical protein
VDSTIFLASEDVKAKLNVILSAVLVFFSITVIISALLLNNKAAQTAGGVLGVIRMM